MIRVSPAEVFCRAAGRLFPFRRLIAIDPGNRCVKIVLLEAIFGPVRIVKSLSLDSQEEGLLSSEEIKRQLRAELRNIGDYAVVLSMPQHLAISQVIDLPEDSDENVEKQIEEETLKIGGVGGSTVVYDYRRLEPFAKYRNPYWITLCHEGEIFKQMERLGVAAGNVCEVTTSGNSLVAAFQWAADGPSDAVLADVGAASTDVVIVHGGQPVFAGSFPVGGDLFTDAISGHNAGGSFDEAEQAKRGRNLLKGPDELPRFRSTVDQWKAELERTAGEWIDENPDTGLRLTELTVFLAGGAAAQPGLIDYLNEGRGPRFAPWPEGPKGFSASVAVACGAGVQVLSAEPRLASVLPSDLRANWQRQRGMQRLQLIGLGLLLLLLLVMGYGTASKLRVLNQRNALFARGQAALSALEESAGLRSELGRNYDRIRPVLELQNRTKATLRAISLLQDVRTNGAFWFVLFGDAQSYYAAPAIPVSTNAAETNLAPVLAAPAGPAFVAELSFAEGGDPMRRALSQVVADLKGSDLFSNVDILPADRRRLLVDSKLLVPAQNFALLMELAESPYGRRTVSRTSAPPPAATNQVHATGARSGRLRTSVEEWE